jgi:hypothetical protein
LFSGDLKYGNIKGFLMEHRFDVLEDETDFPKGLKKGKLNYYDQDLYSLLLKKIVTKKKDIYLSRKKIVCRLRKFSNKINISDTFLLKNSKYDVRLKI